MADIRFDTGLKTFDVNGKCEITFAPTDMAFIEKVYTCLDNMDKKQGKYKEVAEAATNAEIFDLARKMDAEAREEINAVFGYDVCSPIFGHLNLFTVADGFPIWANFMLAIIDQFEGEFAEQKKKTNPRIQKYTAKYGKGHH